MRAATEEQAAAPGLPVDLPRWRFTVADYHRMAEVGILMEDDRVELIAGEIVEMSPTGQRHVRTVNRLNQILSLQLGAGAFVSVQNPIRLADNSEPQPDLAVLRGGDGGTANVADVLLVIEVAESSRDYDRKVKLPLYAAAGIPESWLFDLVAEAIERHTEPREGGYRQIALARRDESLTSTVVPGVTFSVDAILG